MNTISDLRTLTIAKLRSKPHTQEVSMRRNEVINIVFNEK